MATQLRSVPLYKTVLFVACVAILFVNAGSLYVNLRALRETNAAIESSLEVKSRLQYLNLLVVDAENNTRAWFLSGNEIYLGPARAASRQADAEFAFLAAALRDAPAQQKNLEQLRTVVGRKLAALDDLAAVYRRGGLDDVAGIARAGGEPELLDEIRLLVEIMVREQGALERERSARYYRQHRYAVGLGIAINAVAIAVLALFHRSVRRSVRGMLAFEQELQHANATLEQAVAARTERLQVLSQHLIDVAETEKGRLARELHDELGAKLTAIGMDLASLSSKIGTHDPALTRQFERVRATLLATIDIKRHIIEDLRPSMLDHLGLGAALAGYCENYAAVTGLACDTALDDAEGLPPGLAIALFRITQEALNNAAKYAQAARVAVTLREEEGGWLLRVADDGVGIADDAADRPMSHGLLGMRERALLLGGRFTVRRGEDGRGTVVEAWLPAQPAAQ